VSVAGAAAFIHQGGQAGQKASAIDTIQYESSMLAFLVQGLK
jgi:hypothetical protein